MCDPRDLGLIRTRERNIYAGASGKIAGLKYEFI